MTMLPQWRPVRRAGILALALSAVSLACNDDQRPDAMPTAPALVAPDAVSAYIAVSNPKPNVGDHVTVTVRAMRGASVGKIGSFTISLTYGAQQLRFIEAARSSFGMVMANGATQGMVKAAGASADGFGDDVLLSAVFEVAAPNAVETLQLAVDELNSVAFKDQRAQTHVERALYRDNRR